MNTLDVATPPARGRAERAAQKRAQAARFRTLLTFCATLLVAGAGWSFWHYRRPEPLAGYEIVSAGRGDLEDVVTALGKIQPVDYVDVGAQVTGQLKRIEVHVGQQVKAGALLAVIDPQLQQAKVENDRAQLAQLEAERDVQRLQIGFSEAQYQRQLRMRDEGATREDAVERAQSDLRMALAKLGAINAQIRQIQSTTKADEVLLGYTRIYAPLSGTVVWVDARPGQTLIASQQAPLLLRIADVSTMTVWSQVSEVDIARLRPGMELYFTTLGNPTRKWPATLRQLLPAPYKPPGKEPVAAAPGQNGVILYTALFDVDNAQGELLPEMSAQVYFVVGRAQSAVTVPVSAVHAADGGASSVTVVTPEGKLEPRRVTTGIRNRFEVEIREGLSEGEHVVKRTAAEVKASEGIQ